MVPLYADENVHGAIIKGLRRRGVDVVRRRPATNDPMWAVFRPQTVTEMGSSVARRRLTVQEDGLSGADDPVVIERATALGRVLFTHDDDLLAEANTRQRMGVPFAGVVFATQGAVSIGQCIRDLELIAHAGSPGEFLDRVHCLPL